MVIMRNWEYSDLKQAMDDFLGNRDSSDPKVRKRDKIVSVASKLFAKHGYRRTSIDEIARKVGVAKGTVYLYFKTKADLLIYTIGVEKVRYLEAVKPILEKDVPPQERLRRWLRMAFVMANEMPIVSRLTRGDREMMLVLEEMDADMRAGFDNMRMDFISSLLDQGAAPHRWTREEIMDRAQVLLGLMFFAGQIEEPQVRGSLSVERYAGILADMLMDGICAAPAPSKRSEDLEKGNEP